MRIRSIPCEDISDVEHACGSGDGALRNVLCNIPELAHKMIMMIYGAVLPVLKVMFAFT